jgi:PAS domain S-box-containing protein
MRAAIARYDWSGTPLQSVDKWPETLRTVLGVVLDTTFPMLIMWRPDLIQVYNDGYVPIFGDKHPRSLGQPAQECWADIWSEAGPLLRGVYENGEAVFFESLPLMVQRHGRHEQAYFTFSYSPIRANDDVRGVICVANETTAHVLRERETAERAEARRWFDAPGDSRTNEIAFRAFADLIPIMVFQQDVSGAVSFTNSAWHDITHLPRDPSSHSLPAWVDVVHPQDLQRVVGVMSGAIETRGPYEFEYRVKAADAPAAEHSYRWYVARSLPQYAQGQFKGWIGSVVDVHDSRMREEAERAQREAAAKGEREFRALAEAIPVMVWSADASGAIEWYNGRWYEYTGQTPQEAAGWGWQAVHHPEDFPRVMQAWPHSVATGEPFDMEFRLRRHDGEFRTFLTRVRPVRNERGEIERWYGSNVDIQAQKEALERSQRVAETLQRVFLPQQLPHTPQMRIDAVYQAAEKDAFVGGDWFDALQLPDGRVVISIGDVAGHGLDASVIAGRLRQAIVDYSFEQKDPAAVLERVNRVLRYQHPQIYATALVGFIDAAATKFSYASAGHQPPIVAYARETPVETLPYGGVPLGVDEHPSFVSHHIAVPRDAVIGLYTDGITEFAREIDRAEANLKAAVAALVADTSIARPAVAVRDAVLQGEATVDDAALLIVQFSHVTAETLAADRTSLQKSWRFHSSDAYAARISRKELMAFVGQFASDEEALFGAELILGEILANTVEHAPGLTEVHIDWTGEKPVVTVSDTGPGLSRLSAALPQDHLSESGRGLFLISALADEVSVSKSPAFGTELRAVLPLRRADYEATSRRGA